MSLLVYSLRSLGRRKKLTTLTALGMSLAVALFTTMTAFATGLASAFRASGSERRVVVMARGVFAESMSRLPRETFARVRAVPGIDPNDASPETVAVWAMQRPGGGDVTITARGVTEAALRARPNVRVVTGRLPRFGTDEVMAGVGTLGKTDGLVLGGELRPGRRRWHVVGTFEAGGSALESEVWADLDALLAEDNRTQLSSVVLPLAAGASAQAVIERIELDRGFALNAQTEARYYELQATNAEFLRFATAIVALVMGAGAVFGALNTMYTRLAERQREIGVLRAIGFSRPRIVVALIFESLALSFVAGVLGCLGALPAAFQRADAFNIYALSSVSVHTSLTPSVCASGMAFALLIGAIGGLWPALQVTRAPLPLMLRGRW